MTQSIVERWRQRIHYCMEGPKGFAYVLEHVPVEPEKGVKPGWMADCELTTSIEIGFAYPDHPMILAFAQRALTLADWDLRKLEGVNVVAAGLEMGRADARRCRCYSASMLGVADLDRRLLAGAAMDLLLFVHEYMKESGWDAAAQGDNLEAALLFLLAGEIGQAREILCGRRKFKYLKPLHEALLQMCTALGEGGPRPLRFLDVPRFEEVFQEFRPVGGPEWYRNDLGTVSFMLQLELALMRYLYLTHPSEPLNWQQVFEQVAYDQF